MRSTAGAPNPAFIELVAKFYRGLGDPTRLRILEHLLAGEKSVSELVELLGTAQGRVIGHLACLRDCVYVAVRAEGRRAYYRIADPRVPRVRALGEALAQDHAERIFACTRMRSVRYHLLGRAACD